MDFHISYKVIGIVVFLVGLYFGVRWALYRMFRDGPP